MAERVENSRTPRRGFERRTCLDFAWNEWAFIRDHVCDVRLDSEWFENVEPDGTVTEMTAIVQPWKCPYHNGRMCIETIRRLNRIGVNDTLTTERIFDKQN